MKVKIKNIEIGNILSEESFVSGAKYYILDKVEYEGNSFKKGVKVSYVDPDEESYTEYIGEIYRIILDEYGNVEVSFDAPIGRVDLQDLQII